MDKYHVNPKTGKSGKCSAAVCPFGPGTIHAPSAAAAEREYEKAMSFLGEPALKQPRRAFEPVALSTIMDLDLLKRMVREDFVSAKSHPDDDSLRVMTYTKNAQYAGRWNEVTKATRGLIVRASDSSFEDAVVLERPWTKFFTLSQMESKEGARAWALGDEEDSAADSAHDMLAQLDFTAPAEVTDKCDGSLGVLYAHPKGGPAFATKGSFASEQALYYSRLLKRQEAMGEAVASLQKLHPDKTFLFELVGKENQIVLAYEKDDAILLGAVHKATGEYYSPRDFAEVWREDRGLTITEVQPAKSLAEAVALPPRRNREGLVIRTKDKSGKDMQIKLKQEEYLALHRLRFSQGPARLRELVRETPVSGPELMAFAKDGDVEKLSAYQEKLAPYREGDTDLHKQVYADQKEHLRRALKPTAERFAWAVNTVNNLPARHFEGEEKVAMKRFAQEAKRAPRQDQGVLFAAFRARLQGRDPATMETRPYIEAAARAISLKDFKGPSEE